MDTVISIHFSEIALKGKNRVDFEKCLLENISKQLGDSVKTVKKHESRLILTPNNLDVALTKLKNVFGVEWFSPSISTERTVETVIAELLKKKDILSDKKIKVLTRRSDKNFKVTSPELSRKIGIELEKNGFPVDIFNPERIILVEVLTDSFLISWDKQQGLGGLPTGSSGKLLSLLSGGIDSPVASWMMMQRGCTVDFLHFHSEPSTESLKKSKMMKLLTALRSYSPNNFRVFTVSYTEFYKKSPKMDQRSELVVFRRFMLKLANKIAENENYLGLITGDSVAQVASQTLENLLATNEVSILPVYRPLAGMSKQDIIDFSRKIGTFQISIEKYKDCCSLVAAKNPSTKVKLEKVKQIEEEVDTNQIVEKSLEQMEIIEI